MKQKLTNQDEQWARELADELKVKIVSIDLQTGKIIVSGDPTMVKEYHSLWKELFEMGLQGAGGM